MSNPLTPVTSAELERLITDYVQRNLFTELDGNIYQVLVELRFVAHRGHLLWVSVIPLIKVSSEYSFNKDTVLASLKTLLENIRYLENELVLIRIFPPTPLERLRHLANKLNGKNETVL